MRIVRARHLGFCFGVRDAIQMAQQQARQGPFTLLGELVHNPSVTADLRARGIQIENELARVATPTVMVTAHGASEAALGALRRRDLQVLEATCPLVRYAHRKLQAMVQQGYHPVVVGVRNHPEVRGLTEDLAEFDVILTAEEVDRLAERPRYGVVSQTTQPVERSRQLAELIQRRFPAAEVAWADTVCQPTKQRQKAAADLARECSVVVVIGGATSNNTRELLATCRQHCARVHLVQTARELRAEWFLEHDTVGLTAGTSTPDEVIESVEHELRWMLRPQTREPANVLAEVTA